jgi:uncharacterized membrane protein
MYSLLYRIGKLHAITKLLISVAVTILIFFMIPGNLSSRPNFMITWDTFCFMMILLSWITFFTIDSSEIREQSRKQDISRVIIFILVVLSTVASLAEAFLLLTGKTSNRQMVVAVAALLLSGLLIHTFFVFRYAHMYYRNDKNDVNIHAGGLKFPGDLKPDYLDFAYYSFVLGMTFQVSDVQITSKNIRHLSLLHGLLSFFFNTFFIALTINVIAGLREH